MSWKVCGPGRGADTLVCRVDSSRRVSDPARNAAKMKGTPFHSFTDGGLGDGPRRKASRRVSTRQTGVSAPHSWLLPYAASRWSTRLLSTVATWTACATPKNLRTLIRIQDGSNSYQASPCRAEVGWAWWLLCQPSPNEMSATHQLLRESSRVANRRAPHMWVAEFTSQVACRPKTMRKKVVHSRMRQPPIASIRIAMIVTGTQ